MEKIYYWNIILLKHKYHNKINICSGTLMHVVFWKCSPLCVLRFSSRSNNSKFFQHEYTYTKFSYFINININTKVNTAVCINIILLHMKRLTINTLLMKFVVSFQAVRHGEPDVRFLLITRSKRALAQVLVDSFAGPELQNFECSPCTIFVSRIQPLRADVTGTC